MGILMWIAFGFIVGLIARAVMPGSQRLGLVMTTLLGVAGSFAGGAVSSLWSGGPFFALRPVGFVGSVLGAILVMVVVGFVRKR